MGSVQHFSKRCGRYLCTLILLLLASVLLLAANPRITSADDTIQPGHDLFQVANPVQWGDFATTPIPAGFFNPGSDPFSGTIPLQGVPLNLGTTGMADTIVQRMSSVTLPSPFPSSGSIPIELVQLSLTSVNPITITYGGGSPELWQVTGILSTHQQSTGSMSVTRSDLNGGTFSSQLLVWPQLTFTRVSDSTMRTLDYPTAGRQPDQLGDMNVPWSFSCPSGISTPPLDSNFCPAVQSGNRVTFQMFGPTVQGLWELANVPFAVSCNPSSMTVPQGGSGGSSCSVASSGGFNGPVSLSCSGMPVGVTCLFNPNPVTPPPDGTTSSNLTVNVGGSVPTGTYDIRVNGSNGSMNSFFDVFVTVTLPPDFSVSCNPSSLTVQVGSSGMSTCTLTSINGHNSPTSLSCAGQPVGATCDFNPNPVTPPANGTVNSTLTLSADLSGIVPGTYTVEVHGDFGTLDRFFDVFVDITSLPGGTDADGDGVPDSIDNCPNWPNPSQALPPWPVGSPDGDCDGFSDSVEAFVGTNPSLPCGPNAWPPDFNDDQMVNLLDVILLKPHFGTVSPNPGYSVRFDLNADNKINLTDVITLKPFFGRNCGLMPRIVSPMMGSVICGLTNVYFQQSNAIFPISEMAAPRILTSTDGVTFTPVTLDIPAVGSIGFNGAVTTLDASALPPGPLYVQLALSDGPLAASTTVNYTLDAPPVNGAIQASFDSGSGLTTLSAPGTADPDGTITSYTWDFGDGTTASGAQVQHMYPSGDYVVTLTTKDNHNCNSQSNGQLNVPTATISTVNWCDPLTLTVNHAGNSSNSWPANPQDPAQPAGNYPLGAGHDVSYLAFFTFEVHGTVFGNPDTCTEGQYLKLTFQVQLQNGATCGYKFPPDKAGAPGGFAGGGFFQDGYSKAGSGTKTHTKGNPGSVDWLDLPRIGSGDNFNACGGPPGRPGNPVVRAKVQVEGLDWIKGSEAPIGHSEGETGPDETVYQRFQACAAWDSTTGTSSSFTPVDSGGPDATLPAITSTSNTPSFRFGSTGKAGSASIGGC